MWKSSNFLHISTSLCLQNFKSLSTLSQLSNPTTTTTQHPLHIHIHIHIHIHSLSLTHSLLIHLFPNPPPENLFSTFFSLTHIVTCSQSIYSLSLSLSLSHLSLYIYIYVKLSSVMGCFQSKTAHLASPDQDPPLPHPSPDPGNFSFLFFSFFSFFFFTFFTFNFYCFMLHVFYQVFEIV